MTIVNSEDVDMRQKTNKNKKTWISLKVGKSKKMNCLLDFPLKMQPCRYFDFNPVKLILDF